MATGKHSRDETPSIFETFSRQFADLRRAWTIRTNQSEPQQEMTETDFKKEVEGMQSFVDRQFTLIARYSAPPIYTAVIIAIDSARKVSEKPAPLVYAMYNGRCVALEMPSDIPVEVGATVLVSHKTLQILGKASAPLWGETALLQRIVDGNTSEVASGNGSKLVLSGLFADKLKAGDRVVLDSSGSVIIGNLGRKENEYTLATTTGVTWDDIGGLEKTKQQCIEAIEWPYRYPALYEKLGKKPPRGILLFGPPGCGKTMIVKAIASSVAKDGLFLSVKGPEMLDKYVGETERKIREIFARAREYQKETGKRAIIFFDECDAIMYRRGSGQSTDVDRTIVPMFLAEMDGIEESGAVVILATNRPDVLDEAVIRDKRIDAKIKVERPDRGSAVEIFKIHLKNVALKELALNEMATCGADELFSSKHAFVQIKKKGGESVLFTLGHIVSGAMIAAIVDRATSLVLRRIIPQDSTKVSPVDTSGAEVTKEDMIHAIAEKLEENRDMDHSEILKEFVHDFRDEIVGIEILKQASGR